MNSTTTIPASTTLPVSSNANAMVFCLSVVLLNYGFFRSRLVPRWISVWGLVAVMPYLAGSMLVPLAVNEMALVVWLLVKRDASSGRA